MNPEFINGLVNYIKLNGTIGNIEKEIHIFVDRKRRDDENIKYSKTNSKVRLHYLDIRDRMSIEEIKYKLMPKIRDKINLLSKTIIKEEKNKIAQRISYYLNEIKNKIDELIKIKKEVLSNNDNNNVLYNSQKYFINKIVNRIKDSNIKNNIIKFLNNNIEIIIYDFNNAYYNTLDLLNNVHLLNSNKLLNMIDYIYQKSLDLYVLFVDCFLLRRILDKKYIADSIVYTGMMHSINYIFFLIKYCDFKISKIYKIQGNKKDLLNDINNTNYTSDIYKYFFSNNKDYVQCLANDTIIGDIYK